MNVLITGSSGLIGSHLSAHLSALGHPVTGLPRTSDASVIPRWQSEPHKVVLTNPNLFDAVVHLAGHPIVCRWTKANKRKIRESRVQGTERLVAALVKAQPKPRTLISASASGYYGDRGCEWLDEDSSPGQSFLADVAQNWERAAHAADTADIRVVNLRFGIVLSRNGGALASMLPVFRLGFGGRVGDGNQYWSWITLPDLLRVITHCLNSSQMSGPVNAVSPNPVTNSEFTERLGKVLHRPTLIPLPRLAAKLAFGEMAEEALLASARVRPRRLQEMGFTFEHPDLEAALNSLLSSNP